ncbi:F-box protein At1g67340 [Cryptomeria japonica]|uniref:F-box protein At1g67340 n=1 Tax=Cryptomeria japonica TaxID=3369 RepID=UPI0027DA1E06|nr:F-box protein At1g67340 [Cryptomeria japonica]
MPAKRISINPSRRTTRGNKVSPFDCLHDDLIILLMGKLISTAETPTHLVNAMLTCRRFSSMAKDPQVLVHASIGVLEVKASKWSEESHRFLKQCADAGNREACYILGMIQFYCLMNRGLGLALMAEAAIASHPVALYSLAVIHFNGSGGSKRDKNLKTGVILCAKAAALGHIDAIRELGHCLQDGYGVKKNVKEGRRFLVEANAREAEAAAKQSSAFATMIFKSDSSKSNCNCSYLQCRSQKHKLDCSPENCNRNQHSETVFCNTIGGTLLSDFGYNVPPAKVHYANTFLVDWFSLHCPPPGNGLCSYSLCGRPETRRHEFRRCSACGSVNYCSRACQALDWKIQHRYNCASEADWEEQEELDIGEDDEEHPIVTDEINDA